MGLAMARNMLGAGFPLVVWNRTAERCAPLVEEEREVAAGARGARRRRRRRDDGLTDGQAAHSVLVESGLLETLRPGSVVLEMSTIGPAAVAATRGRGRAA